MEQKLLTAVRFSSFRLRNRQHLNVLAVLFNPVQGLIEANWVRDSLEFSSLPNMMRFFFPMDEDGQLTATHQNYK